MRKVLYVLLSVCTMTATAQNITEVADTIGNDTINLRNPPIPQIPFDEIDSLTMSNLDDRYVVVWKGGKCGIYDSQKKENVTRIEYSHLRFSFRKEFEGEFYNYFAWKEEGKNGVVGVSEKTNEFIAISIPETEKDKEVEDEEKKDIQSYLQLARWGNTDACLKLADCYHKGQGVSQSFPMVMGMLSIADRFADTRVSERYITSLPEDDADRLTYEALIALGRKKLERAKELTDKLVGVSPSAAKTMRAVLAIEEHKDTAMFYRLINEAISENCILAKVVLLQRHEADGRKDEAANIAKDIAELAPMAYDYLGKYYKERGEREKSIESYRKANEWACLNREGAVMLLEEALRIEINKKRDENELRRLRLIRDGIGG